MYINPCVLLLGWKQNFRKKMSVLQVSVPREAAVVTKARASDGKGKHL